ncbi:dynamin family protein [Streptomyces endophyticus]|uniref:Dynamin family protein n=1 Tax=Streptomyces endophyticus TaxID=714166 RepID=A0ABU6FCF1_9ACTN|nr:dynamin family protein [Streptomyces endophyticus]MEB8341726.1 dynamin family protein [Streptomyces endophyticus]
MCTSLAPGTLRSELEAIVSRLADPVLRIAIGGRLKSGKSTLLNAILGQRLAPTHRNECTLIPASFRYGPANQVVLHLTDGTERTIAGRAGGGVPDQLPLERAEIRHLTVRSPNRRLEQAHEFVDTPGRDSLSGLDDVAMAAIAESDALLLVMPMPGTGEREALEEYTGRVHGAPLSASNVIGVLSRIDRLAVDDTAELGTVAARLAASAQRRLAPLIADVIPVCGLVAETARGQDFTEGHVKALNGLARDGPPAHRMLFSQEDFVALAGAVLPDDLCSRLLALLDLHGLRLALTAIREGTPDLEGIVHELEQASGIGRLLEAIDQRFVRRTDVLRTTSALSRLVTLAAGTGDAQGRARIRDLARRWQLRPELRETELVAVAHAIRAGVLGNDETDSTQVQDLLTGTTPATRLGLAEGTEAAAIAAEALRRATRWRARELDAPRAAEPHIVTVRVYYEHLHRTALDSR